MSAHGPPSVAPDAEPPPSGAAEALISALLGASIVAALALAAVYWAGGHAQLEGALLAVSLGAIGASMVVWSKRYLPNDEVVEERGEPGSTPEDVAAFAADFRAGAELLRSRRRMVVLLAGAFAALGVAAVFPVRSLGPRPGRGLFHTAYAGGRRLVDADGAPVRVADLSVDGVLTVWPEGDEGAADSPTLLIRVDDPGGFRAGTRREWTVGGVVAYSKLCTHTGCPVGLYQAEEHLLLCPCHQSTFDVLDGARPVFGPAARSLPQLPLTVDAAGHIAAAGDFEDPVGPGFWDRGR